MQNITLTNDAAQRFTVLVGGQEVIVTVSWSDEAVAWMVDISLSNGVTLVTGRRICAGVSIVKQFGTRLVQDFKGDFMAFPRVMPVSEPGRLAWGTTHDFIYVDDSEDVDIATFAGVGV